MYFSVSTLLRRGLNLGLIALCSILLSACGPDQTKLSLHGSDITGSALGKDLDMVDTNGQARRMADYKGKVLVVFFGFTQCPDVCPTALTQLAQAIDLLGSKASQVQVLMMTVDPDRDTPEVLKNYVQVFHPDFDGLTGSASQLLKTAKSFKAFYAKVPGTKAGQYTMDHSSSFYIIDAQGQARALLRGDSSPQEIADDIRQVLGS